MKSRIYSLIVLGILFISLFFFISDLLNWNLFQNNLSESNDWLGYFGSLISSMLTLFVFFETLREERQSRRDDMKRDYNEKVIAARPTFLLLGTKDEQISIELFVRDGTPLRNVMISGRLKSGITFQETLNIKSGELRQFSKDVEYLSIEATSAMGEKNFYTYNAKEIRECNYSNLEKVPLFYQKNITYFELAYILEELSYIYGWKFNNWQEYLSDSEYKWILRLNTDSEVEKIQRNVMVLEKQLPLDKDRLRWKYQLLARIKVFHCLKYIDDLIYGGESNYRLLIIAQELQRFLSTEPVVELNNLSDAFIWEFNSILERFCKEAHFHINSASGLLSFSILSTYVEQLIRYLKEESKEQVDFENRERVRLALYALSNHYQLDNYQEKNYERFVVNLLEKLY